MTATTIEHDAIALFSADGKHWFDADAPDQKRDLAWNSNEAVTKIVIGTDPKGETEDKKITVELPADLAAKFPRLTHLHLWGVGNLESLPELPSGLQCLDVRGCSALTMLPTLPESVETLDLGGCALLEELPAAPASLQRFFVNDCEQLKPDYLSAFLVDLERRAEKPKLVEFDASRCGAISSIRSLPRSLRRMVLEGCENLADVASLDTFTQLQHLNLSACPKLDEIRDLPDLLQYVQLHGSENLKRFCDQDIGPYDRGTEEKPNVAKTLYSRRKFGGELSASAHAKLLLLGDGRVGKTTLAKRLQWDCLTPEQQANTSFKHLKPKDPEPFTHKVQFSRWQTKLQLDESAANELNDRARNAGHDPPCDDQHQIDGSIRIWDFGGQEIYHQTHRVFAAEGSIFLIVWTPETMDREQLMKEKPGDWAISDEEWEEWNRQRSLDYWLEYVHSIRPNAKVALVCTNVERGQHHPPWSDRAKHHASDKLECFYLDSLESTCAENPEYVRLLNFIREFCGAEADRIGIWQPRYYAEVSDHVDELLHQNNEARRDKTQPEHLLISETAWSQSLIQQHQVKGDSVLTLDEDDVGTITGYLHDAGQIFHLRAAADPAIVIDQGWASDLIYRVLHPGTDQSAVLFNEIRNRGGYFDETTLNGDPQWQALETDAEREQILSVMQQCGIVVRVIDRNESRLNRDLYLATEKWLLPKYEGELEAACEARLESLRKRGQRPRTEKFSFEKTNLNEFDFRSLMSHLGNILGTRATWFRDGLHACDNDTKPNWCFQVRWQAADETGFFGHVDAQLVAPEKDFEELARQVEEVFAMDGSPFTKHIHDLRRQIQKPGEEARFFFREARGSDFDVAISSSGADRVVVEQIVEALKADGLRVTWYRLSECRLDDHKGVMKYMKSLCGPPCILLFLSDTYLNNDSESNWYCVYELADAILQIKEGKRSVERTLVAYATDGSLDSNNLDNTAVPVLRKMSEDFEKRHYELDQQDKDTFKYYRDWSDHFRHAAEKEAIGRFFEERGTLGHYSPYEKNPDGSFDFSQIVADVRRALGQS